MVCLLAAVLAVPLYKRFVVVANLALSLIHIEVGRRDRPQVVQRTVYLVPPKPMFECTTPDGKRYTSDDGRGNPRWVPLWTLGYPTVRPTSSLGSNIGHPDRVMHPHPRDINWPVATGGGTWIRDDCVQLPPADVCARLRDRRDAIRTRFFNAQEKERDNLRIEERSVNARLDNDCGGH